ncbi:hypothetical protein RvY_05508-2 [Ramazzottius varieornatus]|nr:hypothetical protein RvY_05508-2 [Ramazzottius varieornatus]
MHVTCVRKVSVKHHVDGRQNTAQPWRPRCVFYVRRNVTSPQWLGKRPTRKANFLSFFHLGAFLQSPWNIFQLVCCCPGNVNLHSETEEWMPSPAADLGSTERSNRGKATTAG